MLPEPSQRPHEKAILGLHAKGAPYSLALMAYILKTPVSIAFQAYLDESELVQHATGRAGSAHHSLHDPA